MSILIIFALTSTAHAACPSSHSAYDCTDDHGDPICTKVGWAYTCSAALGSSTNDTQLYATSDSGDGTYNVWGEDSDTNGFCCTVAANSINTLVVNGGGGDDDVDFTQGLCGTAVASPSCNSTAVLSYQCGLY